MSTHSIPRPVLVTERRHLPRSPAATAFEPRPRGEREFGVGYGRSSGYGRASYIRTWRPGAFKVR